MYSTFVDIPPGGTVTIELDVQGRCRRPGFYPSKIVPQPLVDTEQVEFNVNVAGDLPLDARRATSRRGPHRPLERPARRRQWPASPLAGSEGGSGDPRPA